MKFNIKKFVKYLKWCKQGGYTQVDLAYITYPKILEGRRAIISGGSDGIGLAIAKKMLECGAEVVITGRNEQKLERAKQILASDKLHTIQWDVRDFNNMQSKLLEAKRLLGGRIDTFVNNAGVVAPLPDSDDYLGDVMDTNVKAVYLLCDLVGADMKTNNGSDGGKIINISSLNGFQKEAHPYHISKRAVNAITEGFAKRFAPYNIIVNGIAPGYCNSNCNKIASGDNMYYDEHLNHRIVTPEEIAEIAVFLCSNAANGIIGQTILCDGGASLR